MRYEPAVEGIGRYYRESSIWVQGQRFTSLVGYGLTDNLVAVARDGQNDAVTDNPRALSPCRAIGPDRRSLVIRNAQLPGDGSLPARIVVAIRGPLVVEVVVVVVVVSLLMVGVVAVGVAVGVAVAAVARLARVSHGVSAVLTEPLPVESKGMNCSLNE